MNPYNREIIPRLLKYRDVLLKLKAMGFVKVFSDNLADAVGVSPSLVRKDFSVVGLSGNKRGGYKIEALAEQLGRILGAGELQKVVIAGCGKIGTALMNYRGFDAQRVRIVAGFDVNPAKIDPNAPVPVYPFDEMPRVVKAERVTVAILAVPETAAAHVAEQLSATGIHGILNFAPIALKSTPTCIIQNINIAMALENLFYFVRFTPPDLTGDPSHEVG
jgi:redox-sensing transcriptional repressor